MSKTVVITMGMVASALLVSVACSGSGNQPTATNTPDGTSTSPAPKEVAKRYNALVRFIDARTSTEPEDLYFGKTKAFSDVSYKAVTPYKELPAERAVFQLREAKATSPRTLAENSEGLSDGFRYSVIALDSKDSRPELRIVHDDLSAPREGKAKLRLIHAAPGAGEFDVYAVNREHKNEKVFSGVDFKSTTGFIEVDPVQTNIEVTPSGEKHVELKIMNVNLEAGKLYTFVVVGAPTQKIEAVPIVDTPMHIKPS